MALILTGVGGVKTFIADVPIDVVNRRVFTTSATVTSHPIEDGSSVDDHVIDLPDELEIDGSITNTPASIIDAIARTKVWAEDEFQKLRDAKKARAAVSVISGPYDYAEDQGEGMIIKRITRTDGPEDAVHFTIALRKVTKAESATVAGATRDDDTQTKQKNVGTQVKTPA